jgi:uncharacterized membrane protein YidH (DUF202 family)
MKILGIVLIVLGIVAFAYGGISFTKKEKIVDIGPIEATKKETHTIPLPPVLGGLLVVGGIVVLVASGRKS